MQPGAQSVIQRQLNCNLDNYFVVTRHNRSFVRARGDFELLIPYYTLQRQIFTLFGMPHEEIDCYHFVKVPFRQGIKPTTSLSAPKNFTIFSLLFLTLMESTMFPFSLRAQIFAHNALWAGYLGGTASFWLRRPRYKKQSVDAIIAAIFVHFTSAFRSIKRIMVLHIVLKSVRTCEH
jgi:hypothetical protein